jgi:hypothetical protein
VSIAKNLPPKEVIIVATFLLPEQISLRENFPSPTDKLAKLA